MDMVSNNDDDFKQIIDSLNRVVNTITTMYDSFNIISQDYSDKILEIAEKTSNLNSSISAAFESLPTLDISSKRIEEDLKKSAKIMFENGWWVIPTMPSNFYFQLVNEKDVNKQNLTAFLVGYYNDNGCIRLNQIIKRWKLEEFTNNQDIFEDSLWAHRESKFTLTVPALTIQVEGILRSYFNHISKRSIKAYQEELKKEYEQMFENKDDNVHLIDKLIHIQNVQFLDEGINRFTESFDPGEPRNFDDLHRNPLFHGQYKNYNSIEISTKLFLFLDMLHYILSDLDKH
jgi:hypothetical protein